MNIIAYVVNIKFKMPHSNFLQQDFKSAELNHGQSRFQGYLEKTKAYQNSYWLEKNWSVVQSYLQHVITGLLTTCFDHFILKASLLQIF